MSQFDISDSDDDDALSILKVKRKNLEPETALLPPLQTLRKSVAKEEILQIMETDEMINKLLEKDNKAQERETAREKQLVDSIKGKTRYDHTVDPTGACLAHLVTLCKEEAPPLDFYFIQNDPVLSKVEQSKESLFSATNLSLVLKKFNRIDRESQLDTGKTLYMKNILVSNTLFRSGKTHTHATLDIDKHMRQLGGREDIIDRIDQNLCIEQKLSLPMISPMVPITFAIFRFDNLVRAAMYESNPHPYFDSLFKYCILLALDTRLYTDNDYLCGDLRSAEQVLFGSLVHLVDRCFDRKPIEKCLELLQNITTDERYLLRLGIWMSKCYDPSFEDWVNTLLIWMIHATKPMSLEMAFFSLSQRVLPEGLSEELLLKSIATFELVALVVEKNINVPEMAQVMVKLVQQMKNNCFENYQGTINHHIARMYNILTGSEARLQKYLTKDDIFL